MSAIAPPPWADYISERERGMARSGTRRRPWQDGDSRRRSRDTAWRLRLPPHDRSHRWHTGRRRAETSGRHARARRTAALDWLPAYAGRVAMVTGPRRLSSPRRSLWGRRSMRARPACHRCNIGHPRAWNIARFSRRTPSRAHEPRSKPIRETSLVSSTSALPRDRAEQRAAPAMARASISFRA